MNTSAIIIKGTINHIGKSADTILRLDSRLDIRISVAHVSFISSVGAF